MASLSLSILQPWHSPGNEKEGDEWCMNSQTLIINQHTQEALRPSSWWECEQCTKETKKRADELCRKAREYSRREAGARSTQSSLDDAFEHGTFKGKAKAKATAGATE